MKTRASFNYRAKQHYHDFKQKSAQIHLLVNEWEMVFNVVKGLEDSPHRIEIDPIYYAKLYKSFVIRRKMNVRNEIGSVILKYDSLMIEVTIRDSFIPINKKLYNDLCEMFNFEELGTYNRHTRFFTPHVEDIKLILSVYEC